MKRRSFIYQTGMTAVSFAIPGRLLPKAQTNSKISLGIIADLHQDIMHDSHQRLAAFVGEMKRNPTDVVVQMGDFATPKMEHQRLVDLFHEAPGVPIHVLGNHDTDLGFQPEDCVAQWMIPGTYYKKEVNGFTLLVLDGNQKGSPTYQGGYPSYIGAAQLNWLEGELESADGPVIILSHQPLKGWLEVDDAEKVRERLALYADKIVICMCGHTHIDQVYKENGILYWHVNSASYYWIGGNYIHQSYTAEIHEKHGNISRTCPYSEPLFARMEIDLEMGWITVTGQQAEWVGASPVDLGYRPAESLWQGEEIVPYIRNRKWEGV
jgi:Icc protein